MCCRLRDAAWLLALLVVVLAACDLVAQATTVDTVYGRRISAHCDACGSSMEVGPICGLDIPFVERGLSPGTTAYVAISGYRLFFDVYQDKHILRLQITQGGDGSYVVDANGEIHGGFYADFQGWNPGLIADCTRFTCVIDYLVLGSSGKPCLAEDCRYYVNFIGTGEVYGNSAGGYGNGVARITSSGFIPGSSVFVALIGWHLSFDGNQDHHIREIRVSPQDEVLGGWEDRNGFVVGSDGTFHARYCADLDDSGNDDPYSFVVDYALFGMVDPKFASVDKPGTFPALTVSTTWGEGRGGGSADFGGGVFWQGMPGIYPILVGFLFDLPDARGKFEAGTHIHEIRISSMQPVLGGWQFSNGLPIDGAGRTWGRYFAAINDSNDDDRFTFSIQSLLVGYGP